MTDKEWEELWDFAEKQNVLVRIMDFFMSCNKERFAVGEIVFCKDGSVRCGECDEYLVENLTQKQMKSIIENLI